MSEVKIDAKAQEMLKRMLSLPTNKLTKTVVFDDIFTIEQADDNNVYIDGTVNTTFIEDGKVLMNKLDKITIFDKELEMLRGMVGASNLRLSHISKLVGAKIRVKTRMYVDTNGLEVFDRVIKFMFTDKQLTELKTVADSDISSKPTVDEQQSVLLP